MPVVLDLDKDQHELLDLLFLLGVGVLSEEVLAGKRPSLKLMMLVIKLAETTRNLGEEKMRDFLFKMNGHTSGAFNLDVEALKDEFAKDDAIMDLTGERRETDND